MSTTTADEMVEAARQLRDAVEPLRFSAPVTHVYNPLDYAWAAHEQYVKKFAVNPKRILFLGMNPGPFGMVQTGVPFGEVTAVRDWMGVRAEVKRPAHQHPKRPVLGFDCRRSEVSGQRFWALFRQRFGEPENFFDEHFVVNYCPLAFLEAPVRNLTPNKLPAEEKKRLFAVCDAHLRSAIEILRPEWLIGVGEFAFKRLEGISGTMKNVRVVQILHPSPACPASNNDWPGTVARQLQQCGVWNARSAS